MICERHFTPEDFAAKLGKTGKRTLEKKAVPSIFDTAPVDLVRTGASCPNKTTHLVSKRYCKIKCCCNETGTENKEILFFW